MSDEPTRAFTLFSAAGAAGVDDDPENPLTRATRRLLAEGQGMVSAIPAVIAERPSRTAFWFGFFVLSEGGRILFFPAGAQRYVHAAGGRSDGSSRFDRALDVDHLSLEPDRQTWHLTDSTGRRRRGRQGGGRTRNVGAGRILWFCVTSSGLANFRPLRAATIVRFDPTPNADEARRRVDRFMACVSNGASSTIPLPPTPAGDVVLHVAVVVARPGAPPYNGEGMPFPFAAPGVRRLKPSPGTTASHGTLLLSREIEIQILGAWMPGKATPGPLTFSYAWDETR